MNEQSIGVGTKAPDFKAKDQNGQWWNLSDLTGKRVLLSFHPLAWTSICMSQMQALELSWDRFQKANVIPIGISVDSIPCKKAWAESIMVSKLPMIADFWPHGQIAQRLGIFRQEDGFSERANILIGEDGTILWIKVYPIKQLPDLEEVFSLIQSQ